MAKGDWYQCGTGWEEDPNTAWAHGIDTMGDSLGTGAAKRIETRLRNCSRKVRAASESSKEIKTWKAAESAEGSHHEYGDAPERTFDREWAAR